MDDSSEKLILFRLDKQDQDANAWRLEQKATSTRIFEAVSKTNGRVGFLEKVCWTFTGILFTLITLIGWYITWNPHK